MSMPPVICNKRCCVHNRTGFCIAVDKNVKCSILERKKAVMRPRQCDCMTRDFVTVGNFGFERYADTKLSISFKDKALVVTYKYDNCYNRRYELVRKRGIHYCPYCGRKL